MLTSPIEEIKNRLDIAEVVREYVQLQKAGANYRALCPFHAEKSPSFFVSPARQTWHCFGGCSEGGDVFRFVMKAEGIEFGDALRLLAKKAGVELPRRDPALARWETERKRFLDILERATRFFEKQLGASQAGKEAKAYLLGRGLTEESIAAWRIGYAPDSQKALHDFLVEQGFSSQDIGKAGLLAHAEGQTYDRFCGRIIFPVCDLNSQVVGFGGRVFGRKEGADLAKYVNTPSTPVYDKSKVLYGLDKAKMEIRRQDSCMLVEGYMDAIMVFQAGWENVVATSGTALTSSHLRTLKRFSETLYAAFDRDEAGDAATRRGIDLALADGFRVRVVSMPQGKDPADMAKENPEEWKRRIGSAQSIFDFYFESTLARFDRQTPEGKGDIAAALLPVIKKIPNSIEQAHWIQRLARELDVEESSIRKELEKTADEAPRLGREAELKEAPPKSRKELLEERVLALVFARPENLQELQEEDFEYLTLSTQEILTGMRKNPDLGFPAFEELFPRETVDFLRYIALKSDVEEEETDWEKEFRYCLQELKFLYVKARLDDIAKEIRKAEENNDAAKLQQLTEQFQELSRLLYTNY